jgi:hypothetical protein
MERDAMAEEDTPKKGGLRFSREVRLGEVLTVLSLLLGGFAGWGTFIARVTGIEAAQASQADATRRLEAGFQEVRQEVKETGKDVRDLRSRMDRARM